MNHISTRDQIVALGSIFVCLVFVFLAYIFEIELIIGLIVGMGMISVIFSVYDEKLYLRTRDRLVLLTVGFGAVILAITYLLESTFSPHLLCLFVPIMFALFLVLLAIINYYRES